MFDPRFFLYCEEVDHCRRVREVGWRVVCFADTHVLHIGGESAQSLGSLSADRQVSERAIESELLYFRKHYGLFGMLAAVLMGTIGGVINVCGSLLPRRDAARAVSAAEHVSAQLRALVTTRLASRPTR